jgi:endoglucanase
MVSIGGDCILRLPGQSETIRPPAAPAADARPTVRIKAGMTTPFTDSAGNVWIADQGFDGGETAERDDDMAIANTSDPAMYRTERYGMDGFSWTLPNGKYTEKLHFAETYDGITGPGMRTGQE